MTQLLDKARTLCLKGLNSSPIASSPLYWTIYKSNVNPLRGLQLALTLVWDSLPHLNFLFLKKKIMTSYYFQPALRCLYNESFSS